jgi:Asp-tRNA(Asn)/Glu-tRNA(Gln) amidotransferase A subunit family amidase
VSRKLVFFWIVAVAAPLSLAQAPLNVSEASITEMQSAMADGRITSVELVQQYLRRIELLDLAGPKLNSIVRSNPEALAIAAALDEERRSSGPRSLLHGIPIVVKDNYNTAGLATTGGSVALTDFIPTEEATQVAKLRAAGAIVLAKTNLHEYAYGITTISSVAGQTRNPYDIRRVPGGSSGGTGAAVAASFAAMGLGSDTCGSIRIPAAFNNLFGLRPSKGLSSIYGIMPLSHTQDVGAPLARSLEDLAISLDIVTGYDDKDTATQLVKDRSATEFLTSLDSVDLDSVRLGRLVDYLERANPEIRTAINQALDWYESQGATIVDIEIPELGELLAASGVIAFEFETDLNQYLEEFGTVASLDLAQIVGGGLYHQQVNGVLTRSVDTEFNGPDYASALAKRDELKQLLEATMIDQNLDALVYPPIMELPVLIGSSQPGNNCSISANSGLPALSMPLGLTAQGLPVAMELLGRFLTDEALLALAYDYEQAMMPRRIPAVTPALIAGQLPQPVAYQVELEQGEVKIAAQLSWNSLTNELSFLVSSEGRQPASSVTLSVNDDDLSAFDEPVLANLLRPIQSSADGAIFIDPRLGQGLAEGRVYLKIFAPSLPKGGAVLLVE